MFGTEELRELVAKMVMAMREAPGVGLAAPQIGVSLQVSHFPLLCIAARTTIIIDNATINPCSLNTSPQLLWHLACAPSLAASALLLFAAMAGPPVW